MQDTVCLAGRGSAMADSRGLGIVGALLGAITAVVMLIAGAVVQGHVGGRLALDRADRQVAALSPSADLQRCRRTPRLGGQVGVKNRGMPDNRTAVRSSRQRSERHPGQERAHARGTTMA